MCLVWLVCTVVHGTSSSGLWSLFSTTASLLGALFCTLVQLFTVLLNCGYQSWTHYALNHLPSPTSILYTCAVFPVYMLNSLQSLQHWAVCRQLICSQLSADSCDLLIAFFGCGFQDESIFRGLSTLCIPRSVTSHLTVRITSWL